MNSNTCELATISTQTMSACQRLGLAWRGVAWLRPLLLIMLFQVVAQAQFTYTTFLGKVTITGYTGPGGAVTIPSAILGLPVISIGEGAFWLNDLTSVTIPSSVTSIADYAFADCANLTGVYFQGNAPTLAGPDVFTGDDNATVYYLPSSSGWGPSYGGRPTAIWWVGGGLGIVTTNAASNITGSSATLNGTVEPVHVPTYAWFEYGLTTAYGSTSTEMALPYDPYSYFPQPVSVNITGLQAGTTYHYRLIASNGGYTNYPPGPDMTFTTTAAPPYTYTTSNGSVTITAYTGPGGTVSIPSTIGGLPVVMIGSNSFALCTSLTAVSIPNSVTTIGDSAFNGCTSLTSATLGTSVTSIGNYAFEGCSSLTSAAIPNGVAIIGFGVFNRCSSMASVSIPSSVISIWSSAFSSCSSLTSVTIPNSVTTIGNSAFSYCSSLASITIPQGVTSIGNNAFMRCSSLTSITVNALNSYYSSLNGVLFSKSLTVLIQCPEGKSGDLTIPTSVITIGNSALLFCSNLTSVTIPNSVTTIGDSAFSYCYSLTGITIPNGVTSIGNGAFLNGPMSSITVDAANPSYASVDGVLYSKALTTLIQYPHGRSGSVTIPNSVTTIGNSAFSNCQFNLTNVTIPSAVTSIGNSAFSDCYNLTRLTFTGNAPAMGSNVFNNIPSGLTVYYFSDKTNFTSPTWMGRPSVGMGSSTPVANWLISEGLPYNANLQDDPNGDGVSHLMAYALNLDPQQNLSGSMPNPVIEVNQMSLDFYAGNGDVTYSVETSADLKNWTTTGVTVSAPDANQVRTATVVMTGGSRYMRLVVVH